MTRKSKKATPPRLSKKIPTQQSAHTRAEAFDNEWDLRKVKLADILNKPRRSPSFVAVTIPASKEWDRLHDRYEKLFLEVGFNRFVFADNSPIPPDPCFSDEEWAYLSTQTPP
jgi:hypothetical protein